MSSCKRVWTCFDGHDIEVVRETFAKDISMTTERHEFGASIFKGMGGVAPAMGMIGTLIGLVAMLSNMDDPKPSALPWR